MAEALQQVKRHFGPNAVILHTRTLRTGRLFGVGSGPCVEITAAGARSDLAPVGRGDRMRAQSRWTDSAEGAAQPVPPLTGDQTARADAPSLQADVSILRSLVGDLLRETHRARAAELPPELYALYTQLAENAVAHELAQQLVDRVKRELGDDGLRDAKAVRGALTRAVSVMVPVAGPIRLVRHGAPTMIALVGPTGVGKTTTIAKLAANLHLRQRRKVGLVTIDTYRIAAVEQLRIYAQIIDVPLRVVTTPDGLREAVAGMADRDVILIDTAGRSQNDADKIKELRCYFDLVRPDEVHLVLAGTGAENVLLQSVERFGELGLDRVIFTKLDEAIGSGVMLTCLQKAGAKLSYVTTGQDVPDDIELGQAEVLTRLVLGESRVGGNGVAVSRPAAGTRHAAPMRGPTHGVPRPGEDGRGVCGRVARGTPGVSG